MFVLDNKNVPSSLDANNTPKVPGGTQTIQHLNLSETVSVVPPAERSMGSLLLLKLLQRIQAENTQNLMQLVHLVPPPTAGCRAFHGSQHPPNWHPRVLKIAPTAARCRDCSIHWNLHWWVLSFHQNLYDIKEVYNTNWCLNEYFF